MKLFIFFTLAVAYVNAAEPLQYRSPDADAQITAYENDISPDGTFLYSFGTSNGIQQSARGQLVNTNSDLEGIEINGEVSYTAPDGTPVNIVYLAGPNGYQPSGNVIPTAPPVPEYVLRALAYIEAHPPRGVPVEDLSKIKLVIKNQN